MTKNDLQAIFERNNSQLSDFLERFPQESPVSPEHTAYVLGIVQRLAEEMCQIQDFLIDIADDPKPPDK